MRKPKISTLRRSMNSLPDVMPPLGPPKLYKPPRISVKKLMTYTTNSRQKKAQLDLALKTLRIGYVRNSSQLPPNTKYYKVEIYNKKKKHLHRVTIFLYDGREFSERSKVIVDCHCISEGTLISTENGLKPIESLTSTDPNKKIKYLVNGSLYEGGPSYFMGRKPTYKLTLKNGETLTATSDHKILSLKPEANVLARKEEKYKQWKKVGNLQVGDKVVLSTDESPSISFNEDFYEGYVCGFFMGEGTYYNINKTPRPMLNFVSRSKEILGILNKADVGKSPEITKNQIRIYGDHKLHEILIKYGMTYHNRQTSIEAMTLTLSSNKSLFYGYLSGMIDAEGCVNKGQTIV
jgi:hypothetical protein